MSGDELGDDPDYELPTPSRPSAVAPVEVARWCAGCGVGLSELDDEAGQCRACGEVIDDGPVLLDAPLRTTAKPPRAPRQTGQDASLRSGRGFGRSKRLPRVLSAEEEQVRADRAHRRLDVARFCELLVPTPPNGTADLPPLVERGPQDVSGARPSGVLAKLPRRSGTGGSGSALWLREYHDDGFATGRARRYVSLIPVFYDNTPKLVRLRGAAIYEDEVDEVIRVLTEWKAGLSGDGSGQ